LKTIIHLTLFLLLASPLFAGTAGEETYLRDGSKYLAAGNYLRAAKAFENAIHINPGRADAYAGLGISYMKLGVNEAMTIPEMLEKALVAFNRSLEINRDNADVRYNLGLLYLALDQKDYAFSQHAKLHLLDKQKADALLVKINAYVPPQNYSFKPMTPSQGIDNSNSTKVYIRNDQVRVPVQLCYRNSTVEALLVLDTGANITMITSALADRLGIRPEDTKRMQARLADGSTVQSFSTHIDYITVGPKQKRNLQISIMPVKGASFGFGDGLLGMDFLGSYKYHLDVRHQTLEWQ
jgi:tetratricopeptide (TPR) repeat protein